MQFLSASRARRGSLSLLLGASLFVALSPGTALAGRYSGHVAGAGGNPTRVVVLGSQARLVLRDARRSNRRYRVCVRAGASGLGRCFARRLRNGRSRVNVRTVLARGGPGRYRARWTIGGQRVASWRFRVRSREDGGNQEDDTDEIGEDIGDDIGDGEDPSDGDEIGDDILDPFEDLIPERS